jgi:hypothetical protein
VVSSLPVRILLDLALLAIVLGTIAEAVFDVRDSEPPRFLSGTLADLPSYDPATALAIPGIVVWALLTFYEIGFHAVPGGRLILGVLAIVAFLLTGGYIFSGE